MARANREVRLCEECGRPVEHGREHQLLCRRCQEEQERRKRREQKVRQNKRGSRRELEVEDW